LAVVVPSQQLATPRYRAAFIRDAAAVDLEKMKSSMVSVRGFICCHCANVYPSS
jgi:hypothetical protein